jgi:hypothetical protein
MTARTSPLEPLWRARATALGSQCGMPVPARCGDGDLERAHLGRLGIADVSGWRRATVKGSACAEVVARTGLPVPDAWFEPAGHGGWAFAARTGRKEFFVEGWPEEATAEVPTYLRQDASLLLVGPALFDVLAEVLAIPVDLHVPRLHMVQAARIACVLLPRSRRERPAPEGTLDDTRDVPAAQIWVDPTYALYFAEALLGLGEELGGGFVGVEICEREGWLPRAT